MEPDNETGASLPVQPDGCRRVAVVAQTGEERAQQPQVVVKLTGCLDMPRPLQELDERHELGGRAAFAPTPKVDGRTRCATTTIVLQKAIDDGAVDRLEFDTGEFKPDQEVMGNTPVLAGQCLRNPGSTTEIANEGEDDGGEAGQSGARQGSGPGQGRHCSFSI